MADLLIAQLRSKTDQHSALRSLYSQWDFDEKLIPKALQTVAALFPHYSRHDESHSKQILVNIERILGENIKLLSATDTWLLLESAYWHDIGMVVPQKDLDEAVKNPLFQDFLATYFNQPSHELSKIASLLSNNANPGVIFEENNPLEMVAKFRELMSEWFRQQHPSRANSIVRSPFETIGVSSPRTELIPARLFRLLGRICQMHGAPFKDLISKNGLPFREAGLAQDDCHPRFIACMLRMGDLLDMDDNRFCPVMQRIAGPKRPATTIAHEDKHAAIRHLRIDRERIEVSAECNTVEGYLESFKWFEWLRKEMQDQMANWRDIVPDRELGLLPTLGETTVTVSGNLQILRDGERPAFTVDSEKAMELLQGKNLYDSEYTCIREVLQNAVDATLLRLWIEKDDCGEINWNNPYDSKVQETLQSAAVDFDLKELSTSLVDDSQTTRWLVTIRDQGTGISKSDLEYMLRIGGSQRNKKRQQAIQKMPEWMKPSGAFGIGLQSIFMLTDKLTIITKSIASHEQLEIEMWSPTGKHQGLIILKDSNIMQVKPGTKICFEISLSTFSNSWSVRHDDEQSLAAIFSNNVDPLLDESFPYEAATIYDEVNKFNQNSLIKINPSFQDKRYSPNERKPSAIKNNYDNSYRLVQTVHGPCKIRYRPIMDLHPAYGLRTFYRGQAFETKGITIPNVKISIDILSGKAGSWLNFSRDKLSQTARSMLKETILNGLLELVKEDLKIFTTEGPSDTINTENLPEYSFFLKSMSTFYKGEWLLLADKLGDAWLDVPISVEKKSLRHYYPLDEWSIVRDRDNAKFTSTDMVLVLDRHNSSDVELIILNEWLKLPQHSYSLRGATEIYDTSLEFVGPETRIAHASRLADAQYKYPTKLFLQRTPHDNWDRAALASALSVELNNSWGNRRFYISLCNVDQRPSFFDSLILSECAELNCRSLFSYTRSSSLVIIPFLFTDKKYETDIRLDISAINDLVGWTIPRTVKKTTKHEIASAYKQFIDYLDETMSGTVYWNRWARARGLVKD